MPFFPFPCISIHSIEQSGLEPWQDFGDSYLFLKYAKTKFPINRAEIRANGTWKKVNAKAMTPIPAPKIALSFLLNGEVFGSETMMNPK